jgi:hypothetical protein
MVRVNRMLWVLPAREISNLPPHLLVKNGPLIHSMPALHHLFSGRAFSDLPGLEAVAVGQVCNLAGSLQSSGHALWEKGDRNPLILPAHIPIDEPRVQFELARYLPDQWVPVIEKDVNGPNSLPLRMVGEQPNLGKYSACRRVARTIYLGSAPTAKAANRGLEDRRVKLG